MKHKVGDIVRVTKRCFNRTDKISCYWRNRDGQAYFIRKTHTGSWGYP